MNNNYKMVRKPIKYQNIWLNTENALADSERKIFTFNDLPLIQIRNSSILKVTSITLSGAGIASATAQNWTIKLGNVKYNTTSYFNSDKNSIPTIAMMNYDVNNSVQNGHFSLEIEKQDIKQFTINITSSGGHGAVVSSANINFHMCLTVEEYDD